MNRLSLAQPFTMPAVVITLLALPVGSGAKTPEYTVDEACVHIKAVDGTNPIIYSNDSWLGIFDNWCLWAQASVGKADLRGNIVSRDMWDHPKYYYGVSPLG